MAPDAAIDPSHLWPLPEQVRRALAGEIESGALAEGSRLPPERRLAERYHVSRKTVRAALAGLEAEGLITRHVGKGTFIRPKTKAPDPSKRSLPHVGVVFFKYTDPMLDPLTRDLFEGFSEVLRDSGVVSTTYGLNCVLGDDYDALAVDVGGMAFDVVVVAPAAVEREIPRLMAKGQVLQLGYCSPGEGRSYVGGDVLAGAREAVKALVRLGHRRLAFLTTAAGDETATLARMKENAYCRAIEEVGKGKIGPLVIDGSETGRIFEADGPTAVLTSQTSQAKGVLARAAEFRVRVPEELSLVSFDDGDIGETTSPKFSSLKVLSKEMGCRGARAVVDIIKGYRSPPVQEVLRPEFVMRQTCAEAPRAPSRTRSRRRNKVRGRKK